MSGYKVSGIQEEASANLLGSSTEALASTEAQNDHLNYETSCELYDSTQKLSQTRPTHQPSSHRTHSA